jgi:hypothetical protein
MRKAILCLSVVACMAPPALAALSFHDDFESGVGNWTMTPGAAGALQWNDNDVFKNIDPGGGDASARQPAYQGALGNGWQSYHNFGPQSGYVKAEVYVFEDYTSTQDPIQSALTLTAQNGSGEPDFAEYLRIGVLQFAGTNTQYSFRTATGGFVVTGVARKSGWTKLGIEADAVGDGGQVRFFIDDVQVGTSTRSGADISVITLGQNFSNQENFWYDGVLVTPEPASALLLLVGVPLLSRRRRG